MGGGGGGGGGGYLPTSEAITVMLCQGWASRSRGRVVRITPLSASMVKYRNGATSSTSCSSPASGAVVPMKYLFRRREDGSMERAVDMRVYHKKLARRCEASSYEANTASCHSNSKQSTETQNRFIPRKCLSCRKR